MTRRSDPNPAYWEQYGPFQHVKHALIRCYLNGWYPKLGTWARRVHTHAGRGRYESGDPGSPVLALQTLLRHSYREKLLNASEFNFLFIERDPANLAALEAELSQLKPFPARVNVDEGLRGQCRRRAASWSAALTTLISSSRSSLSRIFVRCATGY
jgi:three-Cys-motif partner protein